MPMRSFVAVAFLTLGMNPVTAGSAGVSTPSLGAHTWLGQGEGLGVNPAVTRGIDTRSRGSVFVAFNAGYANNDGTPSDTYRNRWQALGKPMTYAGYGDRFDIKAYVVTAANGGPDHRVSIAKPGEPRGELSLPFVEIRDATRVLAVAQSYASPALMVASDEVTVDGPAVLLAFWWGDGGVKRMTAIPGDGFTVIDAFLELPDESGVQGAVAVRKVDRAGTYRVHWTAAPVQGASLWLIAIR